MKSPMMINSWGVVAANEKRTEVIEENRMVWNKWTRMEDDRY